MVPIVRNREADPMCKRRWEDFNLLWNESGASKRLDVGRVDHCIQNRDNKEPNLIVYE